MRLRNSHLLIFVALFSALVALPARAQTAQPQASQPAHDPTAEDTTTTGADTPPPPMTPEQAALIERYLTPIHAQPVGKIDSRTAAAGQGITLEVTQNATLANGTELARGTKLTGRVLRARAYQPSGPAAVLSISIDRAVLKDGSTIPIRCVLRSAVSTSSPGSSGVIDASQQGSRRRNSGGSMGGPTNGTIPLGNPTPMGGGIGDPTGGDIGNSPLGGSSGNGYPGGSTNPNSTNPRGGVSGGGIGGGDPGIGGSSRGVPLPNATAVAATDPELPVTAAGESIRDTPHASGLPGVMLSGASVAGVSGTLSAYERNIALDSSTQLTLGIISAK